MCVPENTARPVNVRLYANGVQAVRCNRLQSPLSEKASPFPTNLKGCAEAQPLCLFLHVNAEDVDGLHVRAAETELVGTAGRELASVPEDVDVREGHVHGHGAQLPSLGVEVKAVADLVAAVAAVGAQLVHNGQGDAGFLHGRSSLDVFSIV